VPGRVVPFWSEVVRFRIGSGRVGRSFVMVWAAHRLCNSRTVRRGAVDILKRPSQASTLHNDYMKFCKQMWNTLSNQMDTDTAIKTGPNVTRNWGSIFLLREKKLD